MSCEDAQYLCGDIRYETTLLYVCNCLREIVKTQMNVMVASK